MLRVTYLKWSILTCCTKMNEHLTSVDTHFKHIHTFTPITILQYCKEDGDSCIIQTTQTLP